MDVRTFDISGPVEIAPKKIVDRRGYFSEIFRADIFARHVANVEFVQDNQSLSVELGTIRGIHFQTNPVAQGKLVRCLAGELFDVAVDLRSGSPSFGHWISTRLTADQNNQLWVPVGFGHAFCSLVPNSIIAYRVTNYYSPEHDRGVAWDDLDVAIRWPAIANPETLSKKDQNLPPLSQIPAYFQADAA